MKIDGSTNIATAGQQNNKLRKKAEELCSVFIYEMLKHAGTEFGETSASKMYNSMFLEMHGENIMKNPKFQKQLVDPIVKKWSTVNGQR